MEVRGQPARVSSLLQPRGFLMELRSFGLGQVLLPSELPWRPQRNVFLGSVASVKLPKVWGNSSFILP